MDQDKLNLFLEKLVTDMGASTGIALTYIGDKLGLFTAMAGSGPMTPQDVATKTGFNLRLLTEWMKSQAAGGYLEYDSADETYLLPEEQAFVFTDENSPVYMGGGALAFYSVFYAADRKMMEAIKTGSGIHWGDHDERLFEATERFFRPNYRANLTESWIPALDGVEDRLKSGIRVGDIGCGHAASTIIMATEYPNSSFVGIDYHQGSIETAKQRVSDSGVGDRIGFEVAPANNYKTKDLDLVCFMDCLHDMGDPDGAALQAKKSLNPGGSVLIVEPFANDNTEDNFGPLGRLFYGASTFACTANGVAQGGGSRVLGAQAGESRIGEVFQKAGFSSFHRAAETPFNIVYQAKI